MEILLRKVSRVTPFFHTIRVKTLEMPSDELKEQDMSERENLAPSNELRDAAGALKQVQRKLPALAERRDTQAQLVQKLSAELSEKLDARAWNDETDPQKVRYLKREVTDLSEDLESEKAMLSAFNKAIMNLHDDIEAKSVLVNSEIDRIANLAFSNAQRRLLECVAA